MSEFNSGPAVGFGKLGDADAVLIILRSEQVIVSADVARIFAEQILMQCDYAQRDFQDAAQETDRG